jgi:hypothetical protein
MLSNVFVELERQAADEYVDFVHRNAILRASARTGRQRKRGSQNGFGRRVALRV